MKAMPISKAVDKYLAMPSNLKRIKEGKRQILITHLETGVLVWVYLSSASSNPSFNFYEEPKTDPIQIRANQLALKHFGKPINALEDDGIEQDFIYGLIDREKN